MFEFLEDIGSGIADAAKAIGSSTVGSIAATVLGGPTGFFLTKPGAALAAKFGGAIPGVGALVVKGYDAYGKAVYGRAPAARAPRGVVQRVTARTSGPNLGGLGGLAARVAVLARQRAAAAKAARAQQAAAQRRAAAARAQAAAQRSALILRRQRAAGIFRSPPPPPPPPLNLGDGTGTGIRPPTPTDLWGIEKSPPPPPPPLQVFDVTPIPSPPPGGASSGVQTPWGYVDPALPNLPPLQPFDRRTADVILGGAGSGIARKVAMLNESGDFGGFPDA